MKKLILISLISLLFSFHSLSGDTYKVRTEVFELKVSKVIDIVPYKILTASDKSLNLTGKTSEIIEYLYPAGMESELDFDQLYNLTVESNMEIDFIKKDILFHFLKGAGLNIDYQSHQQTNYILSYHTVLEGSEEQLSETNNSSTQLNLQFKKRIWLKGLSLKATVESLNEALDTNIFEAGDSDLVALPKMYFLKWELEKDPAEYLRSKGFEVVEVDKIVDVPVVVYTE